MNDYKNEGQLKPLLETLQIARSSYEGHKAIKIQKMDEAEEGLHNDPDFINATEAMKTCAETVSTLETEIKSLAVELYKANPEAGKKLADGNVSIKDIVKAEIIDLNLAREWAAREAPNMLILDEKAILKHAKAVKDTIPLLFVEINTEPEANIASEIKFEETAAAAGESERAPF